MFRIASTVDLEAQKLQGLIADPNLQELSCVHNAQKLLTIGDFYGAIKSLRADCDKIQMLNRELYDYIGNIVIPVSQNTVDQWWKAWKNEDISDSKR